MSTPVLWQVHLVPMTRGALLRTPKPFPGNIPENDIFDQLDQLVLFQAADKIDDIDSMSEQNSP